MVLKTELCRFSGQKIYPGRGIRFIRSDSQVFLFLNSKCKRYFHNKLKPSKLCWTAMYRKQHKKAKKVEYASKQQKSQVKGNIPKSAAPKAAKMGGGGGRR
uniref:AT2G36620 protein n=1 Tax=Arabidopsis thaliana TaxID=3702 RepID=C0Z2G1_ARATH|nr:AT2G36620 [Arabidopsis thaliana]